MVPLFLPLSFVLYEVKLKEDEKAKTIYADHNICLCRGDDTISVHLSVANSTGGASISRGLENGNMVAQNFR